MRRYLHHGFPIPAASEDEMTGGVFPALAASTVLRTRPPEKNFACSNCLKVVRAELHNRIIAVCLSLIEPKKQASRGAFKQFMSPLAEARWGRKLSHGLFGK